jgi:undecaprenyl-diphosphatase
MNYLQAALLGLVQGLTEFLPVSSSGHLVIFQVYMGMRQATENITFDIFLHLATVLAVVFVYRRDLRTIFTGHWVGDWPDGIPKWRLVAFLGLSLVATGVILPFKGEVTTLFETIAGVRIFLLLNAAALAVLPALRRNDLGLGGLGWQGAIVIGLAQAVGAFPGISRSGATILAGLAMGLKPSEACRYSFLLSIPTILIAAMVQIPDAVGQGLAFPVGPAAVGFAVALAAALITIPFLIRLVEQGRLWWFSVYCGLLSVALFGIIPVPEP